jgi:hypothetical protein
MANPDNEPPDRKGGKFKIMVSDETFSFSSVEIGDRKVTGAQIVGAAGRSPVEAYLVLHRLPTKEIESIRPAEVVDLAVDGVEQFFVIEGSDLYGFSVNGLSMQWPFSTIKGAEVLKLADIGDDLELVLEREDTADVVVDETDVVNLAERGQEQLKTRKPKVPSIWVNEDKHKFERAKIAYDEVVAFYLGDGGAPAAEYLVKYSKGPPENIKGTLAPGNKVVVKNGMRFRVSGTGES